MGKRGPKPGTGGRPIEWTDEKIEELRLDLEDYSRDSDFIHMCIWHAHSDTYRDLLPMFCERNHNFSDTLKRAKAKAEAHTLIKGANGTMNPTICVFTEKQHGWADLQKIEQKTDITSNGETLGAASLAIYATHKD